MSARLSLTIGDRHLSSWSLRPWLALRVATPDFDTRLIRLRRDDTAARIRAISPGGKVPVLTDGDVVVWESLAICEYIAERFPEAQLWPEDRAARAHARAAASEMHAGFAPLRQHMSMDLFARRPGEGRTPAVAADIARLEALFEDARARFGAPHGGPFLYGRFSIADAMFAPVATRFVTYDVTLGPVAAAWRDAILAHPSMEEWTADARRDLDAQAPTP
jgi:glutathione S-transferase